MVSCIYLSLGLLLLQCASRLEAGQGRNVIINQIENPLCGQVEFFSSINLDEYEKRSALGSSKIKCFKVAFADWNVDNFPNLILTFAKHGFIIQYI